MEFLFFFHSSTHLIPRFEHNNTTRPSFYWFSDRYHNHMAMPNKEDKYIHFFVKNPKADKFKLRSRHNGLGFNGLYKHFLYFKEERESMDKDRSGNFRYCEPSILMSFDTLEPDIIAKFDDNNPCISKVVFPEQFKGCTIFIYDADNNYPIPFNKSDTIPAIIPKITDAYPFKTPRSIGEEYFYGDWDPMITEKMGTWL